MKIALIGYGKMGKAIEEIGLNRGYSFPVKITSGNRQLLESETFRDCDVAIEFTTPEAAPENIRKCLDAKVPVVCGSTGWLNEKPAIEEYCRERDGSFLYASNFSIGVNIFFEVNKKLAALMAGRDNYSAAIREIHHAQKKDAPSGTAITLAEQIIAAEPRFSGWVKGGEEAETDKLVISSERTDPAPGTHIITYSSPEDQIEIIHTAHNRRGFALGALSAAAFIVGRRGVFCMADVLKLSDSE